MSLPDKSESARYLQWHEHFWRPNMSTDKARSPAPTEGMETTEEDRRQWTKRGDDAGRLARDFDRLAAELANYQQIAGEMSGRIETDQKLLDSLNAELATVKRERDEAADGWAQLEYARNNERDRLTSRAETAEAAVARLTAERDGAWNEAMEAAELACLRGRDLYRRNDEGYDDIREAVADGLAITIRALKRPLPGGET